MWVGPPGSLLSRSERHPVTADNFAPDAPRRPGKTPVRTALSPGLLIRPPWPGAATMDENRSMPGQAQLSLVRQSPLLHGRFSFQDEAAGSSPARPTTPVVICRNARRLSLRSRLLACVARAQRPQNASLHSPAARAGRQSRAALGAIGQYENQGLSRHLHIE
jgi:hypothetical protein